MTTEISDLETTLKAIKGRVSRLCSLRAKRPLNDLKDDLEGDLERAWESVSEIERKVTKTLAEVELDALAAL